MGRLDKALLALVFVAVASTLVLWETGHKELAAIDIWGSLLVYGVARYLTREDGW